MAEEQSQSRHVDRRPLLRGVGAAATVATTSLSGCISWLFYGGGGSSGAGPQISFASHRDRITREQADRTVSSRGEFIEAIGEPGTTVWIPEKTTINLTGMGSPAEIANNVTIASNRNLGGGNGGMIRTFDQQNYAMLISENKDVNFRVTGVRIQGPRTDFFDPWDYGRDINDYAVAGIRPGGKSVVVDNCELFGWPYGALLPGSKEMATRGWIHHNSIHHNQMQHLGYGMDLENGYHLIEWNSFDYNRHSIAGFGRPTCGYEARFNIVGPNNNHPHFFQFDMHNLAENIDSISYSENPVAGDYVNIHHNVFAHTEHAAFSIQGIPKMYARFANNWVANTDGAVIGRPGTDLRQNNNIFGTDTIKDGKKWLRQLAGQAVERQDMFPARPAAVPLQVTLPISEQPSLPKETTPAQSTGTTTNG